MRDVQTRLADMLEAIERIERYAARGRAVLECDELVQTWIVYHLQIVGEAARALDDTFKAQHPEVPWRRIRAFRNILVHEYFGVDVERVWNVIDTGLPVLKAQLMALRAATDVERS